MHQVDDEDPDSAQAARPGPAASSSPNAVDGVPRRGSGEGRGWCGGGAIPGLDGVPAFSVLQTDPSPIPVVIAVPHAGRAYPGDVFAAMRHPHVAAPRLEDRLVDLVGIDVARRTGAGILVAHAPRAMIDLNRGPDDVDWEMIVGGRPDGVDAAAGSQPASSSAIRRARSGLGLVPRRLPALGEVWRHRLEPEALAARIAGVHQPYHAGLRAMLDSVAARWGAALLIDLHSMPPLAVTEPGERAPRVVIGDRFGAACDGAIVSAVFAALADSGWPVSHNRPYAGGYVLERHSRRNRGLHAIQIEIDRQLYLDARLAEPGPGYAQVVEVLSALVRQIAASVADCGRDRQRWRAAAE